MTVAIRGKRVGLPRMAATLLATGLTSWERDQTLKRLLRLQPPIAASIRGRGRNWKLYVPARQLERAQLVLVPERVALRRQHYVPGTDVLLLSRPSKMPGAGWSLPAGRGDQDNPGACPFMFLEGPDPICGGPCYAMTGRYLDPIHQAAMQARYRWTRECLKTAEGTDSFVAAMVAAIADAGYSYFRIHDSGDMFSAAYTVAWMRIAAALPAIHFWAPTRSWRAPWMETLVQLNALPNVAVRPSALNFEDPPPMLAGFAAGTSATRTAAYTCPAPKQGHRCGPCRVCWDRPDLTVVYKETGFKKNGNGVPFMTTTTNGRTNGHNGVLAAELARLPALHADAIELPLLPPPRQVASTGNSMVLAPIINMETFVSATRTMLGNLDREKDELHEELARIQARLEEIDEIQAPMRQMVQTAEVGAIRALADLGAARTRPRLEPTTWPVRMPPPQVIVQQAPAAAAPGPDGKRWSRDFDSCVGCHRTDKPHSGGGYCRRCYGAGRSRMARANARAAFR